MCSLLCSLVVVKLEHVIGNSIGKEALSTGQGVPLLELRIAIKIICLLVKHILCVTCFTLVIRGEVVVAENDVLTRLSDSDHTLLIGRLCSYLMSWTLASFNRLIAIAEWILRTVAQFTSPRMEIHIITRFRSRIEILCRNVRLILLIKATIKLVVIRIIVDIDNLVPRGLHIISTIQHVSVTELHLLLAIGGVHHLITTIKLGLRRILGGLILQIYALNVPILNVDDVLQLLLPLHIDILGLIMQKFLGEFIALSQFGDVLPLELVFAVGMFHCLFI